MIYSTFRIGEDIVIEVAAPAGFDPAAIALPAAAMLAVPKDNELAIDFAVDQGGVPLAMAVALSTTQTGWRVTYAHTPSAALAPGIFAVEVTIVGAGGIIKITAPLFIRVHRAIGSASVTPVQSSLNFSLAGNSAFIAAIL